MPDNHFLAPACQDNLKKLKLRHAYITDGRCLKSKKKNCAKDEFSHGDTKINLPELTSFCLIGFDSGISQHRHYPP